MDFKHFNEMTSPGIELNQNMSKMADIDMTNSISSEISTGFSTPPSSSLDTCDSGFTDLYSNSFTLINSVNSKSARTTSAQSAQSSDSSPESAPLFDDSLISAANELQNIAPNDDNDKETGAATAVDRPPPPTSSSSQTIYSTSSTSSNELPFDDAQLDLLNSLDYDKATSGSTSNNCKTNEFNDVDDYNDDSNMSDISDLSDMFRLNADIMPEMQRSINWVHLQIAAGVNPRDCISRIFVNSPKQSIPANVSDNDLWRVIAAILSDPPRRQRLQHIQTLDQVCETIKNAKNIIVLTGAGVSVSCGIPDFRSRDGIYERLRVEYPDMRDPQSMFDIGYFARDPRPFYQFAKEIYPGQFEPSLSHRFIKLLERKGKLLRNYTQNIDTLERVAGIKNVIECHGSFATASCTRCKYKVDAIDIQEDIFNQRIPMCKMCATESTKDFDGTMSPRPDLPLNFTQLVAAGVMKPDIVFFGESLPDKFHSMIELDKSNCDLLIVIGSSLKVRPVALIPSSINPTIPQILINREQLEHFVFDVELLGDSDVIINHLCHTLGDDWNDVCSQPPLNLTNELIMNPNDIHNIPLLANAVIKKPDSIESVSLAPTLSTESDSAIAPSQPSPSTSNQPQPDEILDSSSISEDSMAAQAKQNDAASNIDKSLDDSTASYPSMANFLPDNSYFYNGKNSYVFPGAEIWWNKDSDLESTSSDSSMNEEEDDEDIELEIDNIRNDLEQSYPIADDSQQMQQHNCLHHPNIVDQPQNAAENDSDHHEFNKYLLKRNADTALDMDEVIADSTHKRFKQMDALQVDQVNNS